MKTILKEAFFFIVVGLLYLAFVVISTAIGILTLIPAIIAKIFKSVHWYRVFLQAWEGIESISSRMWLHCRYMYHQEYLPWKTAREQKKSQPKREASPDWAYARYSNVSDIWMDAASIAPIVLLMFQLFISLFSVGMFICSSIMVISLWGTHYYYSSTPVHFAPPPPVQAETLQLKVVDKQEALYGPWANSDEVERGLSSFMNIALLSDTGTIKYSRRYAGNSAGFVEYTASEHFADVKIDETLATFHDDRHNKFRVNVGQTFMFEGDAARAYQLSSNGKVLSVLMSSFSTQDLK